MQVLDAKKSNDLCSKVQQLYSLGWGKPARAIQQSHSLVIIIEGGYKEENGAYAGVIEYNSHTLLA